MFMPYNITLIMISFVLWITVLTAPVSAESSVQSEQPQSLRVVVVHAAIEKPKEADTLDDLLGHFDVHVEWMSLSKLQEHRLLQADKVILMETEGRSTAGEALIRQLQYMDVDYLWIGCGDGEDSLTIIAVNYRGTEFAADIGKLGRMEAESPTDVVEATATDGNKTWPLVLRRGDSWHVAVPMRSQWLIWITADLLHDFLDQTHMDNHRGILLIDQNHPLVPPDQLIAAADLAVRYHIPFAISVIPVYTNPDDGRIVSALDAPEWVEAMRYMVNAGGTVMLDDRTARIGDNTYLDSLEQGVAILSHLGLHPVTLAVSNETAVSEWSGTESIQFSSVYGRQPLKAGIPYSIRTATGMRIYPKTVEALQDYPDIDRIIRDLHFKQIVRDAWITVSVDIDTPHDMWDELLGRLARESVRWVDLRYEALAVQSDWIDIQVPGNGLLSVEVNDPDRWHARLEIKQEQAWLDGIAFVSVWILALVVLLFLFLFTLFLFVLRLRRRSRLFSEREV